MRILIEPFNSIKKKWYLAMIIVQILLLFILLNVIQSSIIPSPRKIFSEVFILINSIDFYNDLLKSVLLTLKGMSIAVVISMILSYLSTIVIFKPLSKLVSLFRYLTITGLIYVFTIMSSDAASLKTSLLLFGIIPFFVTSLTSSINAIKQEDYDLCTTLGMSKWQTLWEVVIIGKLDQVLETMRQNFAIAWLMITTVEGIAMSEGGIGTLIIKAAKYLDMSKVLASLFIIFIFGVLFDILITKTRYWLFPYIKKS